MATESDPEAASDAILAKRVNGGDDFAFQTLLDRHLQPLRTFLALRAPVPLLIDEVAHDAFVFAYHNLSGFSSGSMQAWLRSIAKNLLRDRLKAYARETAKQERYSEHLRWEMALAVMDEPVSAQADHLSSCLEKLHHHQREVLTLRYEQQLNSDEIARRIGRSTLAVRTLLMRVRQQLRLCIETLMDRAAA